jgi:hypothetical protein
MIITAIDDAYSNTDDKEFVKLIMRGVMNDNDFTSPQEGLKREDVHDV